MWHSEADIFKDLMSLDDSGNDETYKILYSRGRGFKTQQKPKSMNSFVDPRTGEAINLNEVLEPPDMCHKSRGRGNALGSFLRSEDQLQKQLRLARPLGSGDNVIEAFCRRNIPAKSEESTASDSESDAGQLGTSDNSDNSPSVSLIEKMKPRVIATRNSKLQQNALINSLTSKDTCEFDLNFTAMKPTIKNDGGSVHDDDDDDDDDNDSTGSGKGDSSVTRLSTSLDSECSSIKSTKSNDEMSGSDIIMKPDGVNPQGKGEQNTQGVNNSSNTQGKSNMVKLSPRVSADFFCPGKDTNTTDEKCLWLRKRFNNGGKDVKSFDANEDVHGSASKNFTLSGEDFPPLRKSNLS